MSRCLPAEATCTYETADAQAASVVIEVDQKDARNHMQVERDTAKALGRIGGAVAGEGAAGADVNAMLNDSTDAPGIGGRSSAGGSRSSPTGRKPSAGATGGATGGKGSGRPAKGSPIRSGPGWP